MAETAYEERGYLTENYRLFHLTDRQSAPIEWHYHTFHKLLLFLRGKGEYAIEGKRYTLLPGDVLVVGSGCIHKPEIDPREEYERYILYIAPEFLRRTDWGCDLETCFTGAKAAFSFVVRPQEKSDDVLRLFRELEKNRLTPGFGREALGQAILIKLLISLTRAMENRDLNRPGGTLTDARILEMLRYLSRHLTENITADGLAEVFSMSKYHMMRRFRAETGTTIHGYVTSKRLLLARDLLVGGVSPMAACYQCGFQDYSAFARAYKKQFGCAPRQMKNG